MICMKYRVLAIVLILFSAYSCSPRDGAVSIVEVNGTEVFVASLNGLSSNVATIPLSSLVESLEVVQLEDHDDAFFIPWFTTVTENYIGVRQREGRPYLLFSRSGQFLGNIGRVGQGPGEYPRTLYDDIIDDKNGLIYLVPTIGNILVYNTAGVFLREMAASERLIRPKLFLSDDVLAILHMSFSEDSPMGFQIANPVTETYVVDVASGEVSFESLEIETRTPHRGQILSTLATPAHFVVWCFSGEIFNTRNVQGVFDFTRTGVDTMFHFDMQNNRIVPVFTMTSEVGIWKNYLQINRDLIMTTVSDFDSQRGHFVRRSSGRELILTDLRNLTSSYVNIVNDFFGNLPIQAFVWTFRNGYFVWNVQPEDLMDQIENRLAERNVSQSDRQQLETLLSRLVEDTNNVVFIGRLRDGIEGRLW